MQYESSAAANSGIFWMVARHLWLTGIQKHGILN